MRTRPSSLETTPLRELAAGRWARVQALELPEQEARWLSAMGVHEGARIMVLRRAVLGGPLHVRTASGGSFALGAGLAARVRVHGEG